MEKLKKIIFLICGMFFTSLQSFAENGPQKDGTSGISLEGLFGQEISTAKKIIDMIMEFAVKYSFQALGGIVVLILGWVVARSLANFLGTILEKKRVDPPVAKFILTIVKAMVMVFALITAMGKFGITIAPFIAGLSVIGFGVSFAVQGPLSNYAAGATLIFTKPFKVGDIVEVAGVMGEVTDMTLARTELKTLDGTIIFVPNKQIIGEVMHNFSELKKLDIRVGISYASDVDKAIEIVKKVVDKEKRVYSTPEPKVGISDFGDSSVNIYGRLWCKQSDFYDVMFFVNREIFSEFKRSGIEIPFPQRDVHIIQK